MRTIFIFFFLLISFFAQAQYYPYRDPITKKEGYADSAGKIILPCIFDLADNFRNNTALVHIDSTCYVINKKGKRLFKFPHKPIHIETSPTPDRYVFFDHENMIVYDSMGNRLLNVSADKFVRWEQNLDKGIYIAKKGNKIGIVTSKGEIYIPIEYEVDLFDGTFRMDGNAYFDDSTIFTFKKDGKFWLINMYGKKVVPFALDSVFDHKYGSNNKNLSYAVGKKDGKTILIDADGKIVEVQFDDVADYFHEPEQVVLINNGAVIFYDTKRKMVVDTFPSKYTQWNDLLQENTVDLDRFLNVQYRNKLMIVNNKRQIIFPLSDYSNISAEYVMGKLFFAVCDKNEKWAVFNSMAEPITPFQYTNINLHGAKVYAMIKDKTFIITDTGKAIPEK